MGDLKDFLVDVRVEYHAAGLDNQQPFDEWIREVLNDQLEQEIPDDGWDRIGEAN